MREENAAILSKRSKKFVNGKKSHRCFDLNDVFSKKILFLGWFCILTA
jgi:hypothetical protein